jgi:hypothetical protein
MLSERFKKMSSGPKDFERLEVVTRDISSILPHSGRAESGD